LRKWRLAGFILTTLAFLASTILKIRSADSADYFLLFVRGTLTPFSFCYLLLPAIWLTLLVWHPKVLQITVYHLNSTRQFIRLLGRQTLRFTIVLMLTQLPAIILACWYSWQRGQALILQNNAFALAVWLLVLCWNTLFSFLLLGIRNTTRGQSPILLWGIVVSAVNLFFFSSMTWQLGPAELSAMINSPVVNLLVLLSNLTEALIFGGLCWWGVRYRLTKMDYLG
jgi:hypothetical protein